MEVAWGQYGRSSLKYRHRDCVRLENLGSAARRLHGRYDVLIYNTQQAVDVDQVLVPAGAGTLTECVDYSRFEQWHIPTLPAHQVR